MPLVSSIILAIILIVVGVIVLKVVAGGVRFVVSIGLFALAAFIFVYLLTGSDPFGIGTTAASVVNALLP